MKYLFLLLLSMPSFADFKDWDTKDKNLWYSYITLSTIDVMQTYDMIQCQKQSFCKFAEANPLFGKEPKIEEIILLKVLGFGLLNYSLNTLSSKNKTKSLWLINGMQFAIILNNHEQGIRFQYSF